MGRVSVSLSVYCFLTKLLNFDSCLIYFFLDFSSFFVKFKADMLLLVALGAFSLIVSLSFISLRLKLVLNVCCFQHKHS